MNQFKINDITVSVWADCDIFIEASSNNESISVDIDSVRHCERKSNDEYSILEDLDSKKENKEYLFSDNYPDEPSSDHFVILSLSGNITLLPQQEKELFDAIESYKKGEISDIGRIRIEDTLL